MAVRSRRLFGPKTTTTALVTAWTCPADRTAIIKALIVLNNSGTVATQISWQLVSAGGTAFIWNDSLTAGGRASSAPWFTMEEGDQLKVIHAGNAGTVWGFGALLLGDPT